MVPPGGRSEDGEHQLADVERVPPVVVVHLHTSSWHQLLDGGDDDLAANTRQLVNVIGHELANHLTIVLLHGAQPSEIFFVRKSFCGKIFARPAESEVVDVELVDEIQVHEHAEGGLPR